MIRYIGVVLLGAAAVAQAQSVQGPTLGYVYDPEKLTVRPVLGVVGSARLGDPFSTLLRNASVSPAGDYAIGIAADSDKLTRLDTKTGEISDVGDAAPPDSIVLSPSGSAAALSFENSNHAEVWKSAGAGLERSAALDLQAGMRIAAISDDGTVITTLAAEDSSMVFAYDGGDPKQIFTGRAVSAMAFVPGTKDLIVSDAGEDKVYLLRSLLDPVVLGTAAKPGAVAASTDGRRVFVASPELGGITVFEMRDGSSSAIECACKPESLQRLGGSALFRLTSPAKGPMWVMDGGLPSPVPAFVPQAGSAHE